MDTRIFDLYTDLPTLIIGFAKHDASFVLRIWDFYWAKCLSSHSHLILISLLCSRAIAQATGYPILLQHTNSHTNMSLASPIHPHLAFFLLLTFLFSFPVLVIHGSLILWFREGARREPIVPRHAFAWHNTMPSARNTGAYAHGRSPRANRSSSIFWAGGILFGFGLGIFSLSPSHNTAIMS